MRTAVAIRHDLPRVGSTELLCGDKALDRGVPEVVVAAETVQRLRTEVPR